MCQSGLRGKRRHFCVDMDFFGTQSGSDDGDELYVYICVEGGCHSVALTGSCAVLQ